MMIPEDPSSLGGLHFEALAEKSSKKTHTSFSDHGLRLSLLYVGPGASVRTFCACVSFTDDVYVSLCWWTHHLVAVEVFSRSHLSLLRSNACVVVVSV